MMSLSIADNNDTIAFLQDLEKIGPFQRFFNKIVSGSYPLFLAAILAMIWANLLAASYHSFWHTQISLSFGQFTISKSLAHWIDEALMTFFFFTVGLEIKREILVGGLSSPKQAALPIAAAVGGMIFPAAIYLALNYGTPAAKGWGIPMATDIAFSLAVLAFLKDKVPRGLRIFLTAFAIADDLGAVIVIALFYTKTIVWQNLIFSTLFLVSLGVVNKLWIRKTLVYIVLGIGMWFSILGSKLLQAPLMRGIKWSHIAGVGLLGGIGFTMSLFISGLSFTSAQVLDFSKLGIIAGSVVSGIAGWIVLGFFGRSEQTPAYEQTN